MFTATVVVKWDAAHRLTAPLCKCNHLHGHSYKAEVEVQCDKLTKEGMVIDFAAMRKLFQGWIDAHFDHALILSTADPLRLTYVRTQVLPFSERVYLMDENPTAENMAKLLAGVFHDCLGELISLGTIEHGTSCKLRRVRVYETPEAWAEYREDQNAIA